MVTKIAIRYNISQLGAIPLSDYFCNLFFYTHITKVKVKVYALKNIMRMMIIINQKFNKVVAMSILSLLFN